MTLPTLAPLVPELFPRRPYVVDPTMPHALTEDEMQAFLEDDADLQDTLDLWDKTSGHPGLLKAKSKEEIEKEKRNRTLQIISGLLIAYFIFREDQGFFQFGYFNPNTLSFRLLSSSIVRLSVLRMAKATEVQMRQLTAQLVNGQISRDEWYRVMAKTMKDEYRAAWLASIGGKANYTRSEISRFGWAMRPHYRWLNNFLDQVISGQQPLNGRMVVRAGMYGRAANSIYQNNLLKVAQRAGFNFALRVLGENENHCHDSIHRHGCIELAALGWVPIGEMVEIGEATCLTFCLCRYAFRK